jgi:hypothetical protein
MGSINDATGRCLCGAVSVTAQSLATDVGACHCNMCRNWGGGPFMTLECAGDIAFTGGEHIAVYDSSDWAQRGFCSRCGTHLFYKLKPANQYMLPAGLFDRDTSVRFDHQIFIDEKPAYYTFSNSTHTMTGEEAFAHFSDT